MSGNKYQPERVYYNMVIKPFEDIGTSEKSEPVIARQNIEQNDSILENAGDYLLAINRFSIPCSLVPIQLADIQSGQNDPNLMRWSVSFNHNEQIIQKYCIYVNESNILPNPSPPNPKAIITPYYYIYNISTITNIINTAIQTCFSEWVTTYGSPPDNIIEPPLLTYDIETQKFSFKYQEGYALNNFQFFMNNELGSYFVAQRKKQYDYGDPFGLDVQFLVQNLYNNITIEAGSPAKVYYTMTDEFRAIQYWYHFKSIVLTSNSMPIFAENIPQRVQGTINSNGILNFSPIVVDFEPDNSDSANPRSIQQYNPVQFRYIDMVGIGALKKINVQVYFSDQYLNLYPVYIQVHQLLTIKFMFQRKW